MYCSKIGGQCPHPTTPDSKLVFVMMPFKGFDNVYDAISIAELTQRLKERQI